ncbi:heat shock protein DnaJ, partial [Periconia macrospinosa]
MPSKSPPADYYDVLVVPKNASTDEIKKAFRRLAIQHHPDKLKSASSTTDSTTTTRPSSTPASTDIAATFRKIREAYETLVDPESRHRYDMH